MRCEFLGPPLMPRAELAAAVWEKEGLDCDILRLFFNFSIFFTDSVVCPWGMKAQLKCASIVSVLSCEHEEVQVCLVFDVRNDKPVSVTCEEIYNLRDMSWFCQVLHCYIFPPQSFSSWKAPLACFTPRVMADIENVRSKSTEQHKLLRKDCIAKQFPFFASWVLITTQLEFLWKQTTIKVWYMKGYKCQWTGLDSLKM